MSDPENSKTQPAGEAEESFGEAFSAFERAHKRKPQEGTRQLEGTVIAVSGENVFIDIGYKTEGVLPVSTFGATPPQPGEKFPVSIKGRDPQGYYQLSRTKVALPTDWSALERAFNDKTPIMGTVSAVIKGGLSVDVGVRAFMPGSRSGVRDAAELEKLVGTEIRCRIIKLDTADEDVVVDRRAVLEEEERAVTQHRFDELKEGDVIRGTVRSLAEYGAFVDLGGVDGLLHVGDISWSRVNKPSDVLAVGQEVEARILKIDPDKRRIGLGLKQLTPHPWDAVEGKYTAGQRVRGNVTRLTDFGAFVELEPGIEGLIHISEMAWGKKVKSPSDIVKPGDSVEAIVLEVKTPERRISLGLKQALGDPWADVGKTLSIGRVVEGPVTRLMKFGAFVQIAEGIEGLIHVSEISAEKRINHPQDMLKAGQVVQAQVISIDPEKRQVRLSMKQLVPTGLDEYIEEHKPGDKVTGRIVDLSGEQARVELGMGVQGTCRVPAKQARETGASDAKADLSSLSSMLSAKWKGADSATAVAEEVRAGQVRSFRIAKLDKEQKKIELELA
jgi:small subunit ribosomal protein S1